MKTRFLQISTTVFGAEMRPALATFFAILLAAGMAFSHFLLSLAVAALLAVALWQAAAEYGLRHPGVAVAKPASWPGVLVFSVQKLLRKRVYALFLLLFLIPAVSGLWSDDLAYWADRTRVRLSFLLLPWVFANLPRLDARQHRLLLYVLPWILAVLCVGVGINFALNADTILFGLSEGRPVPAPSHHIRFNLMIATSIISGGWLWLTGFQGRFGWERRALAVLVVFLFIFIHILSVRSGLAALYAALFFTVARFIWRTRRWGLGLAVLAALVALPLIAVNTVPSLKQRISYMKYDWERYKSGEGETYSDAERWISLQTGWMMWRENPLLGVGAGDLPRETERLTEQYFPKYLETPKLPHNQFLYLLAGVGLIGFLLSLTAIYYPLFIARYRRYYLFAAFQVMAFISFLVEYTIETAMGVAWYLFYTLWFMRMAEENEPSED